MKSFPQYDKIVHIEANNLNGKGKSNCRGTKHCLVTPRCTKLAFFCIILSL